MKIETIVWMIFVLIGAALAGWFGALLVGVLWVGYALGIAWAARSGSQLRYLHQTVGLLPAGSHVMKSSVDFFLRNLLVGPG